MKTTLRTHAFSLSKQLALTAVFAALCLIGTVVIVVPLPFGFFNVGDVFVLLAGWCLGPVYGSVAAAVGSALADVITGFPIYAPATFFIKGLDAFIAYMVWFLLKKCIRKERFDFLPRILSALSGESVMVLGYFGYECLLYGINGAIAAVLGNITQGVFGMILATLLILGFRSIKSVAKFFPHLNGK